MLKIQKLPQQVADMIAAGEVVERPASAAKELIENAIDAGASAITVEARNGGVALLRVTDDGCGMSPEDAETSFVRHATSKIRTADDLAAVKTLGFRGEALAAISSVSKIELLTRERSSELGIAISIEGGVTTDVSQAGCPAGTSIIIRDLFYNTPARQKFLKKDSYEISQVQNAVIRAAQSHPEIAFTFIRDGREELRTPGNGDLLVCLHSLWGREASSQLAKVQTRHMGCELSGYIGRPALTRGSREMQYFFVNGRPVRSRTVTAAMDEALRHSIPSGRFPICSLHLRLPEEAYDVNVHPAKLEVKFINERSVYEIVYAGVRDALLESPMHKEWENPANPVEEPPVSTPPEPPAEPSKKTALESPTIEKTPVSYTISGYAASRRNIVDVESPPSVAQITFVEATEPVPQTEMDGVEDFRVIGEALGGFLLVEQEDRLIMIDKHAAHERRLFDRLSQQGGEAMTQRLISPVVSTLAPNECAVILENGNELEQIGFELSAFGTNTIAVRAVPDGAAISDIAALLSEMAAVLQKGRRSPWQERKTALLEMISCKAAVKVGRRFSEIEAAEVARWVLKDKNLWQCPHGRPVAVVLTRGEIEKQFLR